MASFDEEDDNKLDALLNNGKLIMTREQLESLDCTEEEAKALGLRIVDFAPSEHAKVLMICTWIPPEARNPRLTAVEDTCHDCGTPIIYSLTSPAATRVCISCGYERQAGGNA